MVTYYCILGDYVKDPVKTSVAVLVSLSIIFAVILYFMFVTLDYLYSIPLMFMLFGKFFLMLALRKFSNDEIHKGSLLVKRSTLLYFIGFSILFILFFMELDVILMVFSLSVYFFLSVYLFYCLKKFMKYS